MMLAEHFIDSEEELMQSAAKWVCANADEMMYKEVFNRRV